ncbi:MAG: phage tail sheath family protein [Oscillospiraceae bacterium]|jgi:hypothetical protein|nr:phage tail sheath family protein [Oscillospiraceae bacterium]
MAGGTWETQNKLQPGVYINFRSKPSSLVSIGERGIVAGPKALSWGVPGGITVIESTKDVFDKLGYDITSDEMLFLRQAFRGTNKTPGASKVLVYRLPTSGGTAATATIGSLTVTAKYIGGRGNDISIIIAPDLDSQISISDGDDTTYAYTVFFVETVVDGLIQDTQVVGSFTDNETYQIGTIGDLVNNNWVAFSGSAGSALTPTAGTTLTGGADGDAVASGISQALDAIEPYRFDNFVYDGTDQVAKTSVANFVKRLSYGEGRYCQATVANYVAADHDTLISVKNGFTLNTGETLTPEDATWWVGGVEAGAAVNKSLTNKIHPDAVAAVPLYKGTQLDDAIREGSLTFFIEFDAVKVLTDINSYTSFSPDKGKEFSKNRVIRVLYTIANDVYRIFAQNYNGEVNNDDDGRNLYKAECIAEIMTLQGMSPPAIKDFAAEDIEVLPGNDVDAILINVAIQPVDSVEKVYMTVVVKKEAV